MKIFQIFIQFESKKKNEEEEVENKHNSNKYYRKFNKILFRSFFFICNQNFYFNFNSINKQQFPLFFLLFYIEIFIEKCKPVVKDPSKKPTS